MKAEITYPNVLDFDVVLEGAHKPCFLRVEYERLSKGISKFDSVVAMGLLLRAYVPLSVELALTDRGVFDRVVSWAKELNEDQLRLLDFHVHGEVNYFLEEMEQDPDFDIEDIRVERDELQSIVEILGAAGSEYLASSLSVLDRLDEKIESMFPGKLFWNDELFSELASMDPEKWWLRTELE